MIFSKKVVQKRFFWVSRFWIIQLWTGLGPKILKVSLTSTCVLKKTEHKLRNELWARRQASILSDSTFSEFFLQSITQNCQKRRIFALQQITWDFDIETHIQGTTMWSLTSRAFRKCGSFWASEFLNGSYRCSKLTDWEILGPLQKIRGVAKNGEFLLFSKLLEILILKRISRVRPCEASRPDDSENVVVFERELSLLKVDGLWNFGSVTKNKRR